MNKMKLAVGAAVLVVVVAAVWTVVNWPPFGAGKATGSLVKPKAGKAMTQAMWTELSKHQESFLTAYADQFQAMPDDAEEVLAAFSELSFQVTGPGGLWRKTVPNKYFGCEANEELPICGKFKAMEKTYSKWDQLQQQMMDLDSPKQASAFLKDHEKEIREYLETFVPSDESFSAVQATAFFEKNLASAL